jgi:NADH-quinone oxidoreductase subunit E
MTLQTKTVKSVDDVIAEVIKRYGNSREELIPILNEINQENGYLSTEVLEKVSAQLRVPQSKVLSVATFYQMLSTKPRGRHVIQFCESAPCHVVGGRQVWQMLTDELKVNAGETTSDGKWSLITVSCLGVCGVGPVMIIDDDMYGDVTPDQIPSILAKYE